MQIKAIKAAYRRYAPVYDGLFGPILHPGRRMILQALACRPGERILEVGVGTGLSLPLYPADVKVTGIDLSAEMLAQARRRVRRQGLSQVEALLEMDAENMEFADASFDKVVAMYVVSVVANPVRLVEEMRRVCKPGGDIFIVNHFRARHPAVRAAEKAISPLAHWVGFHADLELDGFIAAVGLPLLDRRRANLLGGWQVLRFRNPERQSQGQERPQCRDAPGPLPAGGPELLGAARRVS